MAAKSRNAAANGRGGRSVSSVGGTPVPRRTGRGRRRRTEVNFAVMRAEREGGLAGRAMARVGRKLWRREQTGLRQTIRGVGGQLLTDPALTQAPRRH